uniref:Uncharacterized protein n=1 Tax=Eutreptiella gymnastica TaxID=73025 RepID=A0A7S4FVD3_9EUGL
MPLSGDEKRGKAADASLHKAAVAAEPLPAKGRHRSRGVKRPAQDHNWDWAKLLAEDTSVMVATWCTLLNMPELSADVPRNAEQRSWTWASVSGRCPPRSRRHAAPCCSAIWWDSHW